jgi:hypothetical protein
MSASIAGASVLNVKERDDARRDHDEQQRRPKALLFPPLEHADGSEEDVDQIFPEGWLWCRFGDRWLRVCRAYGFWMTDNGIG